MTSDDKLFFSIMGALVLTALVVVALAFGPWGCEARWDGFETDWSPLGGCKVLTESGYVPQGNFRVIATP